MVSGMELQRDHLKLCQCAIHLLQLPPPSPPNLALSVVHHLQQLRADQSRGHGRGGGDRGDDPRRRVSSAGRIAVAQRGEVDPKGRRETLKRNPYY